MTRLVWSAAARAALKNAYDYIARDNPPAAERTVARIEAAAEFVARRNIGRIGRRRGTFEKSVIGTRYILIYTRDEGVGETRIATVLHASMDYGS